MSKVEPTPASGGATAWREFWHAQLASHLAALFDSADPAALAELQADAEWVSLRGGETLFRRGDPGNAAYIVISGRLRVIDDTAGERALNEIGAGETLGEMALLSCERRSATVFAVRDSLLARLPAAAFHRLVERHPPVLRRISGLLVERLRQQRATAGRARPVVRTLAVVPAGRGRRRRRVRAAARRALAPHGATLHLDARRVDRALGQEGIARGAEEDPASPRLVQWLNEQELAHQLRAVRGRSAVLELDRAGRPPGRSRAVRGRRRGDARARRGSSALHARWRVRAPRGAASSCCAMPGWPRRAARRRSSRRGRSTATTTSAWTGRKTSPASRAASPATGIGLVLGGGGARGFAHLGVLRALAEAGVPSTGWAGRASARSSPRSSRSGSRPAKRSLLQGALLRAPGSDAAARRPARRAAHPRQARARVRRGRDRGPAAPLSSAFRPTSRAPRRPCTSGGRSCARSARASRCRACCRR